MPKILMIDDDEKLGELLRVYLAGFQFTLDTAFLPDEGIRRIKDGQFDLVILDVMLPGRDGFQVCREIRTFSQIPVIMLTARGELSDRVVGLEMGADDYLPKPFEPRELVARIGSALRRTQMASKSPGTSATAVVLLAEDLELDLKKREARLAGELMRLTTTEFEVLKLFMQNPQVVMNRDRLMDELRGIDWEAFNRSIDVAVSRLRQKLKDSSRSPRFLKTVWGEGYSFIADVKERV